MQVNSFQGNYQSGNSMINGNSSEINQLIFEKNLLEHCCEILFTHSDERFLLLALTEIPNVRVHLYKPNK